VNQIRTTTAEYLYTFIQSRELDWEADEAVEELLLETDWSEPMMFVFSLGELTFSQVLRKHGSGSEGVRRSRLGSTIFSYYRTMKRMPDACRTHV
jgi:hypothetical protein